MQYTGLQKGFRREPHAVIFINLDSRHSHYPNSEYKSFHSENSEGQRNRTTSARLNFGWSLPNACGQMAWLTLLDLVSGICLSFW